MQNVLRRDTYQEVKKKKKKGRISHRETVIYVK